MKLINIGFGNTVMVQRLVAVVNPGSAPSRKLKEAAKTSGRLVDVTEGRRTRSILVTDSNHVILSSVQPDTISQRMSSLYPGQILEEVFDQPESDEARA
ncbi:MAG: DUF370 domain-containing protein [Thermodesulfobacteriota bacterium]